jgi:hypothetical protein
MKDTEKSDNQFLILDNEVDSAILQLQAHALPAVEHGLMAGYDLLYINNLARGFFLSIKN